MRWLPGTLAGMAGLAALACSAPRPPEPTRYLLRASAPPTTAPAPAPARIGLRRVNVAPYLRQPGLALETEPNEIRNARYHRWAEPLEHGLRSLLRAELSQALGAEVDADPSGAASWEQAIDVSIDQLHGTAAGDALLVAAWRVSDLARGEERSLRLSRRQPLAREGYPALVEAEIELVRELAQAIAASLGPPAEAP